MLVQTAIFVPGIIALKNVKHYHSVWFMASCSTVVVLSILVGVVGIIILMGFLFIGVSFLIAEIFRKCSKEKVIFY